MHSFIYLFKAELYKVIRFKAIWYLCFFAFGILLLPMMNIFNMNTSELNRLYSASKFESIQLFLIDYLFIFISFIFPFIIILKVILLKYIEDYSNGWRLLYTHPHSILTIHFSKIAVSILFIIVILFIYFGLVICFLELLNLAKPDLYVIDGNRVYLSSTLHLISYYFFHSVVILMLFYIASLLIKKFTLFIVFSIIFPFISIIILSDYLNPFIHFVFGSSASLKRTRLPRMSSLNYKFLSFEFFGIIYLVLSLIFLNFFKRRGL